MGKKIRKLLCVALAVLVILPTISLLAGAIQAPLDEEPPLPQATGNSLKVEITADKEKYTLFDKIEITATITNTSSNMVNNISAEASFSRYVRGLKKNSETTATKNSLAPGESFQMRFYVQPYPTFITGIDVLVFPLIWLSSLFRGGMLPKDINNDFDYSREYTRAQIDFDMHGLAGFNYGASVTVGVWYGGNNSLNESAFLSTIEKIETRQNQITNSTKNLDVQKELLHSYLLELQNSGEIYDLSNDPYNPYSFLFKYPGGILGGWHVKPLWDEGEFSPRNTAVLDKPTQNSVSQNSYGNKSTQAIPNAEERAIILSAFDSSIDEEEYWQAYRILSGKLALNPHGTFDVTTIYSATVENFKNLNSYGLIAINSHGDIYNGNPAICLDEIASVGNLYLQDLLNNNIAIKNGKYYILPKFFIYHYSSKKLSNPLVHMCICGGLSNDTLSSAWISAGAEAVLGYTDTVQVRYDHNIMLTTFDALLKGDTIRTAMDKAIRIYGEPDDKNTPAYYRVRGNADMRILCGELSGGVKDMNTNLPLSGVKVSVFVVLGDVEWSVDQTITETNGAFHFLLSEGNYYLRFSLDGYVSEVIGIPISRLVHTVMLEPVLMKKQGEGVQPTQSTIMGKVIEQGTNAPLAGVLVEASKIGFTQVAVKATTDANGQYSLTLDTDSIAYNLKFSKSGYVEQTRENVIFAPPMTLSDVIMVPSGGGEQPITGDDGTTNWDFIIPVTHKKTVPAGYTGISTPQDLDNVRNDLSGKYILMNDIDLSSWGNWLPIGTHSTPTTPIFGMSSIPFSGEFDGNGYVIKNMSITDTQLWRVGLFAETSQCQIKNLGIHDGSIAGNTGSLESSCGGISGYDRQSTISNCYFSGTIGTKFGGTGHAGGIVGNTEGSSVASCSNIGSISGWSSGGIAGSSSSTIEKCFNSGKISGSATIGGAGGIVGTTGSTAVIANCYNAGTVSCLLYGAGGIVGTAGGTINGCYNTGRIYSVMTDNTLDGTTTDEVGGIAGSTNSMTAISNCYYLDNVGLAISRGINEGTEGTLVNLQRLTQSQMKQQASFVGFDFTNTWAINPTINNGYPYLRGMQP